MIFQKWWLSYKRRKALRNIRVGMASLFGFDMSHLSDEQIEAGVIKMSKALASTGITVEQFNNRITRALQRVV